MRAIRENGQVKLSAGWTITACTGRPHGGISMRWMTCEQPRPAAWSFHAKGQVREQGAADRDFLHAAVPSPQTASTRFSFPVPTPSLTL